MILFAIIFYAFKYYDLYSFFLIWSIFLWSRTVFIRRSLNFVFFFYLFIYFNPNNYVVFLSHFSINLLFYLIYFLQNNFSFSFELFFTFHSYWGFFLMLYFVFYIIYRMFTIIYSKQLNVKLECHIPQNTDVSIISSFKVVIVCIDYAGS